MNRSFSLAILLVALFFSGVAGIVNQVIWQRALKLFFGGSETFSTMVIVFVFILGLGVGSVFMGARAKTLVNPIRTFWIIEVLLFLVNLTVAGILGLDLTDSIYSFQRMAVGVGVPIRLLYVFGSLVLLLPPCFLMGMTMPVASEGCQRQLGYHQNRLLTILFFLNTIGAVLGATVSGFVLLPLYGQRAGLLLAALCNLAAGLLVAVLARSSNQADASRPRAETPASSWVSLENRLGFALGFLSLGYEIYLFRLMALTYEPLPYTFATTLCLFLLFWSVGVYLASFVRERIPLLLLLAAASVSIMPWLYRSDRWGSLPIPYLETVLYFVPCIFFGILFGQLVSRAATQWGTDVGRFLALNTIGSSLGILIVTLVGYEMSQDWIVWALALGLLMSLATFLSAQTSARKKPAGKPWLVAQVLLGSAAILLVAVGIGRPFWDHSADLRAFYGRDGVIEVMNERDLIWDGLWHSGLSNGRSHIRTNNWRLAALPYLAHGDSPVREALVIGLGAGVTAATLSKIPSVESVDVYDINRTLVDVLAAYPAGTLGVGSDPKINLIWQDGRSGIALNPKTYDLITQQPLYLKQAGSSLLLSREYMELVRSRLSPDGVFCIYSNALGVEAQARLVRETAASVFPFYESFMKGYLLIASNSPIVYDRARLSRVLRSKGAFAEELRTYSRGSLQPLLRLHDRSRLAWQGSGFVITDDHPLVEYPKVATRLLAGVE